MKKNPRFTVAKADPGEWPGELMRQVAIRCEFAGLSVFEARCISARVRRRLLAKFAEEEGVSLQTVKNTLVQARKKLRAACPSEMRRGTAWYRWLIAAIEENAGCGHPPVTPTYTTRDHDRSVVRVRTNAKRLCAEDVAAELVLERSLAQERA